MEQHHPTKELLALIMPFIERTGMTMSAFGVAAVGDPALVKDLQEGREPRWSTTVRVREFIETGIPYEKPHRPRDCANAKDEAQA